MCILKIKKIELVKLRRNKLASPACASITRAEHFSMFLPVRTSVWGKWQSHIKDCETAIARIMLSHFSICVFGAESE
uniref:Uncharacterized protein n=1 Tax=Anguilla anguilla TaxID=7936 RepID=A0A0E9SF66_ANGAN